MTARMRIRRLAAGVVVPLAIAGSAITLGAAPAAAAYPGARKAGSLSSTPGRYSASTRVDWAAAADLQGRQLRAAILASGGRSPAFDVSGARDLWVMAADGTHKTELTVGGGIGTGGASWSPAGDKLAVGGPCVAPPDNPSFCAFPSVPVLDVVNVTAPVGQITTLPGCFFSCTGGEQDGPFQVTVASRSRRPAHTSRSHRTSSRQARTITCSTTTRRTARSPTRLMSVARAAARASWRTLRSARRAEVYAYDGVIVPDQRPGWAAAGEPVHAVPARLPDLALRPVREPRPRPAAGDLTERQARGADERRERYADPGRGQPQRFRAGAYWRRGRSRTGSRWVSRPSPPRRASPSRPAARPRRGWRRASWWPKGP